MAIKTTVIVQARMDSTRLPGKAMLPLGEKPMLYHVLDRASRIRGAARVVLATGQGDENIPLMQLAESMGIAVFTGSLNNVLSRFFYAAEEFGGDYIIRVTGDNPFTDPYYGSIALSKAIESEADVYSISNLPIGTGVGVISRSALIKAFYNSSRPYEFEHVSPYILERPDEFKIRSCVVPLDCPFDGLRLTIDTPEDYEFAGHLYDALYKDGPFYLDDVIDFLRPRPELIHINSGIQQRPMTLSSCG